MARQIRFPPNSGESGTLDTSPADDYKDRLVKLIPSEIITAYVSIKGIINGLADGNKAILLWGVIILLTLLVPVYLIKFSNVIKIKQIVFTTIAFAIWVVATGSPVEKIGGFNASTLGSIVLIAYTLFIPLVYKQDNT